MSETPSSTDQRSGPDKNGHSPAKSVNGVREGDAPGSQLIAIVDRRAFSRECLARAMGASNPDIEIATFSTTRAWLQDARSASASLVLLCTGPRKPKDEDVSRDIALLTQSRDSPPVALLSDEEDPGQVIAALDKGVRGYIPTSLALSVAVEAMHLVRAGGTYVPASSLLSCRRTLETKPPTDDTSGGVFTSRQTAVLRALREGKANKLIAYELNMRESTVKVHVRNIMKKLKARNRTEVAFKTSELFTSQYQTNSDPGFELPR
jgi:DNA-binding NarL/FixJ family response regulator